MKKIILIIAFIICAFSAKSQWSPTGEMSAGNMDFVYAMTSNTNGGNGYLFASSWATGIYRSTNQGVSWTLSGLDGKRVSYLTAAPNGDIYGLSHTQSFAYIHRSTDNGNSWTDVYTGSFPLNYAGGGAIAFPLDGSIVAAFAVTVGPLIGNVGTFVFRSTNGGDSWFQTQQINLGFVGGMQIISDGRIFLGTSLGGVLQSSNTGNSFTNLTTFPPIFIRTIIKSPDNTIYVSDAFGLNRSTDNGMTFENAGSQNSTAYLRAAIVKSNEELFISTDDRKVFYSNDKGDSWTQVNNGLPANSYVYSFTLSNGKIFAGTNNAGVYVYDGLTNITSSNNFVTDFKLEQNYPNPFNPVTKINYTVLFPLNKGNQVIVLLKVYDVLGNEIETLVNEKQNAGSYSIKWPASDYPSGTYFYSLKIGDKVETKSMVLLK